jgi:hypothetical protein
MTSPSFSSRSVERLLGIQTRERLFLELPLYIHRYVSWSNVNILHGSKNLGEARLPI